MPTSYNPPAKRVSGHGFAGGQPEYTELPADKLKAYRAWLKKNGVADADSPGSNYDYRGAYLAGQNRGGEGHFRDTYKQHGHETFSEESQYSKGPGDGGTWQGDTFIPAKSKRKGKS